MENSYNDFNCGLIQPSIIHQLKKILDQYPDYSQILKELIQNAEDAGATEVKFLYDKNEFTNVTISGKKSPYMGPALYAYNDAVFKDSDWRGIRMLSDSVKKDDPTKVGRFGLGFKSVFHITDFPSIASGRQVGFIDPLQHIFPNTTGGELLNNESATPYKFPIFNFFDAAVDDGFCKGTIFRFPLRETGSKLSQTIFDELQIDNLFKSFEREALKYLLFMKSVESIELWEKDLSAEPVLRCRVCISESCLPEIREVREAMKNAVENNQPNHLHAEVHIELNFRMQPSIERTYLLSEYFIGQGGSQNLQVLVQDKELSYLPLCGVAYQLDSKGDVEEQRDVPAVFCMLPISTQDTTTDLPVHVNGFFALEQNRKHLKWPESDWKGKYVKHWNKLLLSEVLSVAYYDLLLYASGKQISSHCIWEMIPDSDVMRDDKWTCATTVLLEMLISYASNVFPTTMETWTNVNDGLFIDEGDSDDSTLVAIEFMESCEFCNMVKIPNRAISFVKQKRQLTFLSPSHVKSVVKKNPQKMNGLSHKQKLHLAEYSLLDGKYSEMGGIALLPLANGIFTKFSTTSPEIFFAEHSAVFRIYPNLSENFVDDLSGYNLQEHFEHMSATETFQVRKYGNKWLKQLLTKTIRKFGKWTKNDRMSFKRLTIISEWGGKITVEKWICALWKHLMESNYDLHDISVLPILPSIKKDEIVLHCLESGHPKVMAAARYSPKIADDVQGALTSIGVTILHEVPHEVQCHPNFGEYVHDSGVNGVVRALLNYSSIGTTLRNVSHKVRAILICFLASSTIEKDLTFRLKELPLFHRLGTTEVTSVNECPVGLHVVQYIQQNPTFPIHKNLGTNILDLIDANAKSLAVKLNCSVLNQADYFVTTVFPIYNRLTKKQQNDIIEYIQANYLFLKSLNQRKFCEQLSEIAFICVSGVMKCPKDLYDPREQLLRELFGTHYFPSSSTNLDFLSELGMKKAHQVSAADLADVSRHVSTNENPKQAKALLAYLERYPDILKTRIESTSEHKQQLKMYLTQCRWIPLDRQEPQGYPIKLKRIGRGLKQMYVSGHDVYSSKYTYCVGSVLATIDISSTPNLSRTFQWGQRYPQQSDVLQHLENVVLCYDPSMKVQFLNIVWKIYELLSSGCIAEDKYQWPVNWIWNGNGFSMASKIMLVPFFTDVVPYMYCLPHEVAQFERKCQLFTKHGVCNRTEYEICALVLAMMKDKFDRIDVQISEQSIDVEVAVTLINRISELRKSTESTHPIYLPTDQNGLLKFLPVCECTYLDENWYKRGIDVDLADKEVSVVHEKISSATAQALCVPALISRLVDIGDLSMDRDLHDFSYGQHESLTTRLSNLLKDYPDGSAVPKELLQNADDAGATEIKFIYDERENEDARTGLFDPNMSNSQGPALWVYNNAVFNDADFENIIKLSGCTKMHNSEKIGRFGLGFNAVYNLTDVPSFVSRDTVVIFDPHTTFIGTMIKDKRKPGIKLDMIKQNKLLKMCPNQFKPFHNIMGFKPDESFNGTLFRFPLRNALQALQSQISHLHYDKSEMKMLINKFAQQASNMLLFTQNVRKVVFLHIKKECTHSDLNCQEIFTISKSSNSLGTDECPDNFLKYSSKLMDERRHNSDFQMPQPIVTSREVHIVVEMSSEGVHLLQEDFSSSKFWITSYNLSTQFQESFKMSESDDTLIPLGATAIQIDDTGTILPLPLPSNVECLPDKEYGMIYCFLPLPIHSRLPVHINGTFALSSNRRSLVKCIADDKVNPKGSVWNDLLMCEAVCSSYISAMEMCKYVLKAKHTQNIFDIFPRLPFVRQGEGAVVSLFNEFYRHIVQPGSKFFTDGNNWYDISSCCFLTPELRYCEIGNDIFMYMDAIVQLRHCFLIDVPNWLFDCLKETGQYKEIEGRVCTKNGFLRSFLKILEADTQTVPACFKKTLTNRILRYVIRQNDDKWNEMIKYAKCIPVEGDDSTLKRPSDLVHPKLGVAPLFLEDELKFPDLSFRDDDLLKALCSLGMITNDLPWEDILERVNSICRVKFDIAYKRSVILAHYVMCKQDLDFEKLRHIPFLFVKTRPDNYCLPWAGDTFIAKPVQPEKLYGNNLALMVGTIVPILADDYVIQQHSHTLTRWRPWSDLGIHSQVETYNVFESLDLIKDHVDETGMDGFSQGLETTMNMIYTYFSASGKCESAEITNDLSTRKSILCGNTFVFPGQVALKLGRNCSPYLFELPQKLQKSFRNLMLGIGVKKEFCTGDFVDALLCITEHNKGHPLDSTQLRLVQNITEELYNIVHVYSLPQREIFLPDTHGCMTETTRLCFDDCEWIPSTESMTYCSEMIRKQVAQALRVKTKSEQMQFLHSAEFGGEEFGQGEKLTNRLKRILEGYPTQDILKELVQNADDAGAHEIHFIIDPRSHSTEHVFNENWKDLQGPALLVYNDISFTKDDLLGIQELGEGSKGTSAYKIGQYGVGFNCVYHFTDVPMFRTLGPEVGNILCIFDPHMKYVEAKKKKGRMYQVNPELKEAYQSVFDSFLEDHFDFAEDGTMFRFPLRTVKMAKASKLSKKLCSEESVRQLFKSLGQELEEIVIFLNSVTKIALSEIKPDGSKNLLYSVCAKVEDHEDQLSLHKVRELRKGIHRLQFVSRIQYTLEISNQANQSQKWLVVTQLGLDSKVDESLENAVTSKSLNVLPRGGVAFRLEPDNKKNKHKAYCFLPLPGHTPLPFHVNGHFALDHETRRQLFSDSGKKDIRSLWNEALLRNLVAPCFACLVLEVRSRLWRNDSISLEDRLNRYQCLFPPVSKEIQSYWDLLSMEIFKYIEGKELKVLPVKKKDDVEWFSPKDRHVYFDTLSINSPPTEQYFRSGGLVQIGIQSRNENRPSNMREMLLLMNFNLVSLPRYVYTSFRHSGVDVHCTDPSNVISFLKKYPHSWLGNSIQCTPFENIDNMLLMIKYCQRRTESNIEDILECLPFCLTKDQCIQQFTRSNQVFVTEYSDLFPYSKQEFLDRRIWTCLRINFGINDIALPSVMKHFKIEDLERLLPTTFGTMYYMCSKEPELLDKIQCTPKLNLTDEWVNLFWRCITSTVGKVTDMSVVHDLLKPLWNWTFIPVMFQGEDYWAPIRMCQQVINFENVSLNLHGAREALKRIGLPELGFIDKDPHACVNLPHSLVGNLNNPATIVNSLGFILSKNAINAKLSPCQCISLLKYFNDTTGHWQKTCNCIVSLRKLPCFETMCGNYIPVIGHQVYVIPDKIETAEMDVWKTNASCGGTVFVKSNPELEKLYSKLGFIVLSVTEAYTMFIFKHFDMLTEAGQLLHLKFICDIHLRTIGLNVNNSAEEDALLAGLHDLEFLKTSDGQMLSAKHFYDPRIELFKVMEEDDSIIFTSPPYDTEAWWTFFAKFGLVTVVTPEMFIVYAKQIPVEVNRTQGGSLSNIIKRSTALVDHMFQMPLLLHSNFLQKIKLIPFLFQPKTPSHMKDLCMPHTDENALISFSGSVSFKTMPLVWSLKPVIPNWADPSEYHWFGLCQVKKFSWFKSAVDVQSFIFNELGVLNKPPVNLVIENAINISDTVSPYHGEIHISKQHIDVVDHIYEYLTRACENQSDVAEDLRKKLGDKFFILIGEQMVKPYFVIQHLASELRPYLYQLPDMLFRYRTLFNAIGVSAEITINHYCLVLREIFEISRGGKLDPNQKIACQKALTGIFIHLDRDDSEYKNMICLFLLHKVAEIDYVLYSSAELIYVDNQKLLKRVNNFDKPLMASFKQCGIEIACYKERRLIEKLTEQHRPVFLTSVVKEVLIRPGEDLGAGDKNDVDVPSEVIRMIQNTLKSKEFLDGYNRLLHEEWHREKSGPCKDQIRRALHDLCLITIVPVDIIETKLQYVETGKFVHGSETQRPYFEKPERENGDLVSWKLYVKDYGNLQATNKALLFSFITSILISCGQLYRCSTFINHMLTLDISAISGFLDEVEVPYVVSDSSRKGILPTPGSFIPINEHHLLKPEFLNFEKEEYVGLQVADEINSGGGATYIYAVVVSFGEGGDSDDGGLSTMYTLNIGTIHVDHAVRPACLIYKFHQYGRKTKTDEYYQNNDAQDIVSVMDNISRLLVSAFTLCDNQRDAVIKRLLWQYNTALCSSESTVSEDIINFILSEVQRLQLLHEQDTADITSTCSSTPNQVYRPNYIAWNSYIKTQNQTHKRHRDEYLEALAESSRDSDDFPSYYRAPRSFAKVNPQPLEAKRWILQSKDDMEVAETLLRENIDAYEWIVYISHQAVEKSMKGCQHAVDTTHAKSHSLVLIAYYLGDNTLRSMVDEFTASVGDINRTRYPDRHAFPKRPHNAFSCTEARKATQLGKPIVEWAEKYVQDRS